MIMLSSCGAITSPWRLSTLMSYLMLCPILSTAGSLSTGCNLSITVRKGSCAGFSPNISSLET